MDRDSLVKLGAELGAVLSEFGQQIRLQAAQNAERAEVGALYALWRQYRSAPYEDSQEINARITAAMDGYSGEFRSWLVTFGTNIADRARASLEREG